MIRYTANWRVGAYSMPAGWPASASGFFTGNISSVQIYSAALTIPQVLQNFYAGPNGTSLTPIPCPANTIATSTGLAVCTLCPVGAIFFVFAVCLCWF